MTDTLEQRLNEIYADTHREETPIFEEAARIIKNGGLVAFPTETVYGLGGNALDPCAVKKIFEAKGRPSDNPLIIHVCDVKMAETVVVLNLTARFLIKKFWPGPLSLVLNAQKTVPSCTRGGLETAAVRMPDNRIALELIKAAGVPIAAPSANKSGRPSPTDAGTVRDDLKDSVDMVLDGGVTKVGLESTVLDVTGDVPVLLRPGGISKEELERALGEEIALSCDVSTAKRSPGTRYRHYAPNVRLILSKAQDAERSAEGFKWAWIGISNPCGNPCEKIIFSDLNEYARELFRVLRQLETSGAELIVAEYPKQEGIGLALFDRLFRASEK